MMKRTKRKTGRWGALLLSLLLVVSVLAGCGDSTGSSTSSQVESSSAVSQPEESSAVDSQSQVSSSSEEESSALKPEPREGEASQEESQVKEITLKVVHGDGSEKEFPLSTTADTLGEALEAEGLIAGEESSYGLFITTVDGETADDANQEWWCLTKGGEVWNYGADSTQISDGDTYELTLTVGY